MRVASLNLCTDSMLFELADPVRIVSVTSLSRDPDLSHFADVAQQIPVNHGAAEEIIALEPDLVLAGRYTASTTSALLSRLGFHVMTFEPDLTVGDFRASFLQLAAALGTQTRATKLLKRMDRSLANIGTRSRARWPRAIIYRPNGFSPGYRSLANEMLKAAGIINLAHDFGIEYGGFVPLEQLVAAVPDIIILDASAVRYPALAELILTHPALSHPGVTSTRAAPVMRINIAEKYWTCGGTYLADAAERLATLGPR